MLCKHGLSRLFSILCSIVSLIYSCIALALWAWLPTERLGWLSDSVKANSALAFFLVSLALLLIAKNVGPRGLIVVRVLAFTATAIGALTLVQHLTPEINFGIDNLIREDPNFRGYDFAGRMSPHASVGFTLLGLGVALMEAESRRMKNISVGLLFAVGGIAGTALIGYIYQATALYQLPVHFHLSQYVAIVMLLLVGAALFAHPDRPGIQMFLSRGPDGVLVRRLLPAVVLVPGILCWIVMRLRESDYVAQPTAYSILAMSLIVILMLIILSCGKSVRAIQLERERALKQETSILETINLVGQSLVAELNIEKLVQSVTDAATSLSRAQFGAFFYNVTDHKGDSYVLYSISGAPREKFSQFPQPRNTAVFHPTFAGLGTVRSDDITKDPRYGKNAPYYGMPKGHLPVRSYLAVPVISRNGEVIGGLFFGHEKPGIFTQQSEKIVEGLAAAAAIAMDNARLYREVQESVRARDEFMSVASHELKTPLTTLKLQAQIRWEKLMQRREDFFNLERLRKTVNADIQQIGRLTRLVDDMLDVGRISRGKMQMQLESFPLREMINEVNDQFLPQFKQNRTELVVEAEDDVVVHWDRVRIEQVVGNLISNALKYGNRRPVHVSYQRLDEKVRISVRDHGVGIAKENHERIFGRFERAVNSVNISGLGLGLYISKQVVLAHHGRIFVESELGKGSTFVVELPLNAG